MPFPNNPSVGDTYVENDTTYEYLGPVNGWYRKEVGSNNDTTYIGSDGAPGGVSNDTEVIFNDNGSLASDSGLTYNKTTDALSGGAFVPTGSTVPSNGVYRPSANNVAISTNGTGRLFVDANGNAKFTQSIIATKSDGTTTAGQIARSSLIITSGSQDDLGIATTGHLRIATGGSTETFRFTSDGKLGLGTSSPYQKLTLRGTNEQLVFDLNTTTNGQYGSIAWNGSSSDQTTGNYSVEIRGYREAAGAYGALGFHTRDVSGNSRERLRIDSSGRVGIGVTGPSNTIDVNGTGRFRLGGTNQLVFTTDGGNPYIVSEQNAPLHFGTNSQLRATIDSSGRLLVGTSSARSNFYNTTLSARFQVEGANNGDARASSFVYGQSNASGPLLILGKHRANSIGGVTAVSADDELGALAFQGSDGTEFVAGAQITAKVDGTPGANDMPGRLEFSTTSDSASSPTERLRIDSTGRIIGYTGGLEITRNINSAAALGVFISSSATTANQFGLYVRLDGDPNNTGQYFLECYGGANRRATIRSNGGLANYQSNNVDLSDERTKRDIETAPSTWDCVQAWNVVNYNYLDDAQDESVRIGVIAQQVQQHCPEVVVPYQENQNAVVDDEGNIITPAIEERLGVREQQMMWMAIKALQEAQLRIETLEAEVAALKSA